jgi:uncharacterized protein (DUF433 family)
MSTNFLDRISVNSEVCNGKPCIKGTRITVQTILEFVFAGETNDSILAQFPILKLEDIEASKDFAVHLMGNRYSVYPITVAA